MALIKCPECKRDISEEAGVCPHCGKTITANDKQIGEWMHENAIKKSDNRYFVLSTIFAVIFPIVGLILGIYGICKHKPNSIGITILSIVMGLLWFFIPSIIVIVRTM